MKLVEINRSVSFANKMNSCNGRACHTKMRGNQPNYRGIIVVENPRTKAALRLACDLLAADAFQKKKI